MWTYQNTILLSNYQWVPFPQSYSWKKNKEPFNQLNTNSKEGTPFLNQTFITEEMLLLVTLVLQFNTDMRYQSASPWNNFLNNSEQLYLSTWNLEVYKVLNMNTEHDMKLMNQWMLKSSMRFSSPWGLGPASAVSWSWGPSGGTQGGCCSWCPSPHAPPEMGKKCPSLRNLQITR